MMTLQSPPQPQARTNAQVAREGQVGDLEQSRQSEQQTRDTREVADRQQSGDDGKTFTVSTDDWF